MSAPHETGYRSVGLTKRDTAAALPSLLLRSAGYECAEHPVMVDLARHNMKSIAAWLGDEGIRPNQPESMERALRSGMGSAFFVEALEMTGRQVIRQSFGRRPHIGLIARPLPQPDYRPQPRSTVAIVDGNGIDEVNEGAELPLITATGAVIPFEHLRKYGAAVLVRREDIINDDATLVAQLFEEAGRMLINNEWRACIDLLESDDNVPELDQAGGDARPWFTDADRNLVTGSDLDDATLSSALDALRSQPAGDGEPMGLKCARLLIPQKWERAAGKLLTEASMQSQIDVVVSPQLQGDAWYALADPNVYAAVGVGFIGDPGDPIRTWSIERLRKMPLRADGVGYHVRQVFRPTRISRRGIVKVAPSS